MVSHGIWLGIDGEKGQGKMEQDAKRRHQYFCLDSSVYFYFDNCLDSLLFAQFI